MSDKIDFTEVDGIESKPHNTLGGGVPPDVFFATIGDINRTPLDTHFYV